MIASLITRSRKIVVKLGSNTLADSAGRVNQALLARFARDAAALLRAGKQIAVVSSGAQVAGLATLSKWTRKRDIHYRQALCAVGQVKLMEAWSAAFEESGFHIGQILLTRDDFGDPIRTLNMRNTLFTLADEGIVPIINENDTVGVEEIKIGDNDTLAAQSAILWGADLLILFSDIDGLFDRNPKTRADARLVEEVRDLAALRTNIHIEGKSDFGTGGIVTKLSAAERCLEFGIPLLLTHGGKEGALSELAAGNQRGTIFFPPEDTAAPRARS